MPIGARTDYATTVTSTPPALRRATERELLHFAPDPGHIGFPPAMKAGDSPDFSCMAYQSATAAMGMR